MRYRASLTSRGFHRMARSKNVGTTALHRDPIAWRAQNQRLPNQVPTLSNLANEVSVVARLYKAI